MLTLDKIYQASHVLRSVIRKTDLIYAPKINPESEIYLKTENLQVTGSFKVRGAYYMMSQLSEEEKAAAKKDMESMLDYIDKLNELDTSGVEPMSHVFPVHNVFREDVVTNGDGGEDTLANAPERRDRAFVVPKTVDQ